MFEMVGLCFFINIVLLFYILIDIKALFFDPCQDIKVNENFSFV